MGTIQEQDDGDRRRWHVGREIPVAVMFTLLVQTGGVVWWAANITAKLESLTVQVQELRAVKYTAADAVRDQALLLQRVDSLDRRLSIVETQVREVRQ